MNSTYLVLLSADTAEELSSKRDRLVHDLLSREPADMSCVGLTLRNEISQSRVRASMVCEGREDAIASLQQLETDLKMPAEGGLPVTFVFPGMGNQYPGMASEYYNSEPIFAREVEECCRALDDKTAAKIRDVLLRSHSPECAADKQEDINFSAMIGRGRETSQESAEQIEITQPAMFVLEYSLAKLWMHWGLRPSAMIGYSIGEYVAAAIAGVLSRDAALRVVGERARWIASLPKSSLLAVPLPEQDLKSWCNGEIFLAAVHGPKTCVLGGSLAAVEQLEARLAENDVISRRVNTSHAFHTELMRAVQTRFEQLMSRQALSPPAIPFISNVTGTWITSEQAVSPAHWASHLCEPVQFAASVSELSRPGPRVYLEVGPGNSLSGLISNQLADANVQGSACIPTLPSSYQHRTAKATMLHAVGQLWCAGIELDWNAVFTKQEQRRDGFAYSSVSNGPFPVRPLRSKTALTGTQQELAAIWKSHLRCDTPIPDDEFFDLGGDSLSALQMLRTVRIKFHVKVNLRDFLRAPSLAKLAQRIDDGLGAARQPVQSETSSASPSAV